MDMWTDEPGKGASSRRKASVSRKCVEGVIA